MNAPMKKHLDKEIKTIYGRANGMNISDKLKRLMIGAEIVWFDSNPLSQDMDDCLHFFFESHTSPMTDLLLCKQGLTDVSQYVNIPFLWGVQMELYYSKPNRQQGKPHVEPFYFQFRGTIFPMTDEFRKMRDLHYMTKNMEFLQVPDDHKNKKIYSTTKFKCVVIGV